LVRLQFRDQNYLEVIKNTERILASDEKTAGDYLRIGLAYGELNQCSSALPLLLKGFELTLPSETSVRSQLEDGIRACGGVVPVAPAATPTGGTPQTPTTAPAAATASP
jgi:hypothetical protein